jgi:serine/threonine protein kinase/Flp pilus assembly protein TadD
MTPEHWQQVKEMLYAALERTPEQRSAFLDDACQGNQALRREIEALLAAYQGAGSFLERPAIEVAAELMAEEPAGTLVGRSLSHFRVLSLLGVGGMGEVYLAEDKRLHRKVALKLLSAKFTADADRVRRFEQEARSASALNHPNIIIIFEIGEADDAHYIATEYVPGQTLRQMMACERLSFDAVLSVATQVANALAEAHKAGVLHRDIKPENLMVRPDGVVKVLDFGLAKLLDRRPEFANDAGNSTASGMVMGTARYMSPEQARGQEVSARTDIFSLGVALYEMIAGKSPFDGRTSMDVIGAILHVNPTPLSELRAGTPADIEQVVMRALRKDREERYQTAEELLADLASVRCHPPLSTESEARVNSRKARYRVVRLAAALLTLLLVAGGVFFYAHRNASPAPKTRPAAEDHTNNPEAKRLYLIGQYEFSRRSSEAMKKGRDAFEQAIKLDPNYAAAWVGVANCWTVMGQIDDAHQSDAITHAKAAITGALELDDSLVEAHAALALIKTNHEWDWEGAEREYRRALALDANYAPGWHWYAMHLSLMGRYEEAISAIHRAEELDPVSLVINCNHGWILWCARRNDEAIAQLRKTIDLDPYFANAHDKLANVYETTGQYAEAVEQRALDSDLSGDKPEVGADMRAAYRRGGWLEFARHEVGRLQRESQTHYHNPKYLALAWARLGDKDRALEWLKRGYAERSEAMIYLKVDPRYDSLRDDPRFVDLLRRMRFSP